MQETRYELGMRSGRSGAEWLGEKRGEKGFWPGKRGKCPALFLSARATLVQALDLPGLASAREITSWEPKSPLITFNNAGQNRLYVDRRVDNHNTTKYTV